MSSLRSSNRSRRRQRRYLVESLEKVVLALLDRNNEMYFDDVTSKKNILESNQVNSSSSWTHLVPNLGSKWEPKLGQFLPSGFFLLFQAALGTKVTPKAFPKSPRDQSKPRIS